MHYLQYILYLLFFFVFLGSFGVFFSRIPIYSVLYLIFSFINMSIILLILGFNFFAYIYVIIYVGAIAILFLFTIMMTEEKNNKSIEKKREDFISSSIEKAEDIQNFAFLENCKRIVLSFVVLPFSYYIAYLLVYKDDNIMLYESIPMSFFAKHQNIVLFDLFSNYFSINFLNSNLYTKNFLLFFLSGIILFVGMVGAIVIVLDKDTSLIKRKNTKQLRKSTAKRLH